MLSKEEWSQGRWAVFIDDAKVPFIRCNNRYQAEWLAEMVREHAPGKEASEGFFLYPDQVLTVRYIDED